MKGKPSTRMRASGIVLLLLLNWVAVPVALGAGGQEACAMLCCIEDGYCCCTPRRPSVQRDPHDDRDRIDGAQMVRGCPQDCATTAASSQSFLRAIAQAAGPHIGSDDVAAIISPPVSSAHEEIRPGPSSPRSPPSL